MNYNYIVLNLSILHYILLLYYIILYYIVHLFYSLFTIYLKVAMVRLNWRGLNCGNQIILGEKLVREADCGGGDIIQCLFSSDVHFLLGCVDVKDGYYKNVLGRLYFIISF